MLLVSMVYASDTGREKCAEIAPLPRADCQWRFLPREFFKWRALHPYFAPWSEPDQDRYQRLGVGFKKIRLARLCHNGERQLNTRLPCVYLVVLALLLKRSRTRS